MNYAVVKYKLNNPDEPEVMDASTAILLGKTDTYEEAQKLSERFGSGGHMNDIYKNIDGQWFSGGPGNWEFKTAVMEFLDFPEPENTYGMCYMVIRGVTTSAPTAQFFLREWTRINDIFVRDAGDDKYSRKVSFYKKDLLEISKAFVKLGWA